jgi:hypothetical protein
MSFAAFDTQGDDMVGVAEVVEDKLIVADREGDGATAHEPLIGIIVTLTGDMQTHALEATLHTPPTSPCEAHDTHDEIVEPDITGAHKQSQIVPLMMAPGVHHGEGVTEGVREGVVVPVPVRLGVALGDCEREGEGVGVAEGAIMHELFAAISV